MLRSAIGPTSYHSSKQAFAVCQSTALTFNRSINWTLEEEGSLLLLPFNPSPILSFFSHYLLDCLFEKEVFFFSAQARVILQDLTGKPLPNTNVLLIGNFSAKFWMKHTKSNAHTSSVPHQRENTLAVGCANTNPCALRPSSTGSGLVLASEDL